MLARRGSAVTIMMAQGNTQVIEEIMDPGLDIEVNTSLPDRRDMTRFA